MGGMCTHKLFSLSANTLQRKMYVTRVSVTWSDGFSGGKTADEDLHYGSARIHDEPFLACFAGMSSQSMDIVFEFWLLSNNSSMYLTSRL